MFGAKPILNNNRLTAKSRNGELKKLLKKKTNLSGKDFGWEIFAEALPQRLSFHHGDTETQSRRSGNLVRSEEVFCETGTNLLLRNFFFYCVSVPLW